MVNFEDTNFETKQEFMKACLIAVDGDWESFDNDVDPDWGDCWGVSKDKDILARAFDWDFSGKGSKYWGQVYTKLKYLSLSDIQPNLGADLEPEVVEATLASEPPPVTDASIDIRDVIDLDTVDLYNQYIDTLSTVKDAQNSFETVSVALSQRINEGCSLVFDNYTSSKDVLTKFDGELILTKGSIM